MTFFHHSNKHEYNHYRLILILWICLVIFFIILGLVFFFPPLSPFRKSSTHESKVSEITKNVTQGVTKWKIASYFASWNTPRYFLVLFQNNTEMRPTGGFIGSFAVIRMYQGKVEPVWIDDSYNLDRFAEGKLTELAPKPLTRFINVKYWYFRDSNWNPDFSYSAVSALRLFHQELKFLPEPTREFNFDGVIAITPTVIERLLSFVGPIRIEGREYNAANFTSELQKRVEQDYTQYGDSKYERKDILKEMVRVLLETFPQHSLRDPSRVVDIIEQLLREKQILLFSTDKSWEEKIVSLNWGGTLAKVDAKSDYVSVFDANLGSLKTDAVMQKSIHYEVGEHEGQSLQADLLIRYVHPVGRDWKTSTYRSYTRIFLPAHADHIRVFSATGPNQNEYISDMGEVVTGLGQETALVDTDVEIFTVLGKKAVGVYITVAPESQTLIHLQYDLPSRLYTEWQKKRYQLLFQKQPGTRAFPLKVDLNDQMMVKSWSTELNQDKEFGYVYSKSRN